MPSIDEWICALKDNQENTGWFLEQSDELYTDLQIGLQNTKGKRHHHQLAQVVLLTLPFLPSQYRLAHWQALLNDLIAFSFELKDTHLRYQLLNKIGFFFVDVHAMDDAKLAFLLANEIALQLQMPLQQIEVIIGYLWMQAHFKLEDISYRGIEDILAYHADWRTGDLAARLHQAIAAFCNQCLQHQQAITFGCMAYEYWKHKTPRTREIEDALGRTAYVLAVAYRHLEDYANADCWLLRASEHYSQCDNKWQYCSITYETATLHYHRGDYDAAIQWYEIGWEETRHLDDVLRQQRTLHGLGIAYSMDRRFLAKGKTTLQQALRLAEDQNNEFDIVHIRHSLAFNTARLEAEAWLPEFSVALKEIDYGYTLCDQIKDAERRVWLQRLYDELLEMIHLRDQRLFH